VHFHLPDFWLTHYTTIKNDFGPFVVEKAKKPSICSETISKLRGGIW